MSFRMILPSVSNGKDGTTGSIVLFKRSLIKYRWRKKYSFIYLLLATNVSSQFTDLADFTFLKYTGKVTPLIINDLLMKNK